MFVNVAWAEHSEYVEELAFRVYVTDSLQLLGENKHLARRWYDSVRPKKVETMDAMEIVSEVMEKAGLVVRTHESA